QVARVEPGSRRLDRSAVHDAVDFHGNPSAFAILFRMNDRAATLHALHARGAVRTLVASQIREVANAGLSDPDILPFWLGEPDEVPPAYIRAAAAASLAAGETFYTLNFGIPELREALARYLSRLHRPIGPENIAVTASGMSALMLSVEALI